MTCIAQAAGKCYNSLPERGKEFVQGSLYSSAALVLSCATCLLYKTGVCEIKMYPLVGEFPNCGNEPTLTIATHAVLPLSILNCAIAACTHFGKAFS